MTKLIDYSKRGRFFYVIEAMIEYFISILVTGAYLAKISESLGISDTLTGILTSFVSLGCGFQIVAIFLSNKKPVKRWVTLLHTINQLLFSLLYLIPFINFSQEQKIIIFVVFLLLGHVLNNVVQSPKINLFMSLVDDNHRGSFTANKEIVSLLGGAIFSFAMGTVIDSFETIGNLNGAFIVAGISIFALTIFHSLTIILTKEKEIKEQNVPIKKMLCELFCDKKLFKIIAVSIMWSVVSNCAIPFYGSYQNKELGFSMTFISILAIGYSVVRAVFSRAMGKFADKYSFAKMLNICYLIMLVAFIINIFTVRSNGTILFTIYYMLYAVAMAGVNSAVINLIYDYVDEDKRIGALALSGSLSGFAGFFTTLCVSPLVSFIQGNGDSIFGVRVYAQQVLSLLSAILLVLLLIYLNVVVIKGLKNKKEQSL